MNDPSEFLDPEETLEWIPALGAFARSLTRDAERADDLVQETLLKAIHHREKFQIGTNLRAWLFRILRNTYLNDLKKWSRERPGGAACVSCTPSVDATQEICVQRGEVLLAMSRLPDHYRETLVLVLMEGESYETTAEICRCAVGTVKSRVNRARRMIIEELEPGSVGGCS